MGTNKLIKSNNNNYSRIRNNNSNSNSNKEGVKTMRIWRILVI